MTKPRPMPEDYLAVRLTMGAKTAATHYRADKSTVKRWDDSLPLADRERVAIAAKERQRRSSVKNFTKSPARRKARRSGHAALAAMPIPEKKGGIVERAKHHLRRYYANVFDAGALYGRALAGVYVVGHLRLDEAGLIALAVAKGFDADAWRRVTV